MAVGPRDRRGCTFCVFRYQPFTRLSTDETVELLLDQYRVLVARYGVHEVWLQSEAPLRFLEPFILAVDAAGIALTEVTVRAFPAHLLSKREALFQALEAATQVVHRVPDAFEVRALAWWQLCSRLWTWRTTAQDPAEGRYEDQRDDELEHAHGAGPL